MKPIHITLMSVAVVGLLVAMRTVPWIQANAALSVLPPAEESDVVMAGNPDDVGNPERFPETPQEADLPMSDTPSPYPTLDQLIEAGWDRWVGQGRGVWVSAPHQRLYVIEKQRVVWETLCATASAGIGAQIHSYQTPPGWHRIVEKIGEGEPLGRVFRARKPTQELWKPGMRTKEDLVLTRVFLLDGLEAGVNQGKDAQGHVVDSRQRYIYIHGTNEEGRLGTPSSKGCVRVSNAAALELFSLVPVGTLIYIEP